MSDQQPSQKNLRMPDLNRVTVAGNMTRDPELRYLTSGTAVCKIGIAVSRKFKTKTGETREDTVFLNVTCWGNTAEFVNEYTKKGTPVMVEGRLTMNEWEDKNTGQKRSTIEVTADRIQPLCWNGANGGYNNNNNGGGQGNQGQQNQQGGQGSSAPRPRQIEEPIPSDDIPF